MVDEIVISHAITEIAMGASKAEVRTDVAQNTNLRKTTIDDLLKDALKEALAQGVEQEDIDPSWFS